jgi:hypothetical protein
MKEQVQKTGVRKWAGQDLVDLQHEPLVAITAFFEEYGSCIIRGCDVIQTGNTYSVTPGMVALEGTDQNGQPTFKVAPFAGITGVTLPIYLTLSYSTLERAYADLKVKPIAYDFRAAAAGVKPTDKPYLEVGVAGGKSFVDAIQDAKHRFLTDTERSKLTGIEANANNYVHPAKHPASMIEQDDQNRMVSAAKISEWNAKATPADVAQKIAELVASSPAALDTLNELAAALGNDPNFAATMTKQLAGKASTNHTHDSYLGKTETAKDAEKLGGLSLSIIQPKQTKRDFVYGTLIKTSLWYQDSEGASFLFELQGNSYSAGYPFDLKIQGYMYNNTIIHKGGISQGAPINGIVAFCYNGYLCFWFPRQSYWQGFSVFVEDTAATVKINRVLEITDEQKPSEISKEVSFDILNFYHTGNFKPENYATIEHVKQKVAELVASSPAALDTLNELAAALGNDPNFATTVMNALAGKAPSNHVHDSISSLDSIPALAGANRNLKGMRFRGVIDNGYPGTYGNVIQFQGPLFGGELFIDSRGGGGKTGNGEMWLRVISDWATSEWSDWVKIFHSGNFDPTAKADTNHNHDDKYQPKGSYLTQQQLEACFPSGTINPDGSKKEHFLDVICAGMVDSSGSIKDYWGENRVGSYPFAVDKIGNGRYRITHNANIAYYGVLITARVLGNTEYDNYGTWDDRQLNSFVVNMFNDPGSFQDMGFNFVMYRLR